MIDFDLRNPDHVRDPYPVFARLRQDDPVHRSESSAVQRPSIPRAVFATRTCQCTCGSPTLAPAHLKARRWWEPATLRSHP